MPAKMIKGAREGQFKLNRLKEQIGLDQSKIFQGYRPYP